MRLLITALACLISMSVYGQTNLLLHEASRDSLIGEPDEAGNIQIWWPPYKYGGRSEISFEFALFTAIEKIICFNGDTTFFEQIADPDSGIQQLIQIEHVLNNFEDDTIKLNMNQFFYSEGINIDIEIISNNVVIASYLSKFHQSNLLDDTSQEKASNNFNYEDFKRQFEAEMDERNSEYELLDETHSLDKQNNIISLDYDLVRHDINLPSEGASLTESYILPVTCNLKCLTSKLHEVNMDFTYIFKGGYNVWLHDQNHTN